MARIPDIKNTLSLFFRILTMDGKIKHIVIGMGNALLASGLGFCAFTVALTDFFTAPMGAESFILGSLNIGLPISLLVFGGSAYYFTSTLYLQEQRDKARIWLLWFSIGVSLLSALLLTFVIHVLIHTWDLGNVIRYWNEYRPWFFRSLNDVYIDSDMVKIEIRLAVYFLTYILVAVFVWRKRGTRLSKRSAEEIGNAGDGAVNPAKKDGVFPLPEIGKAGLGMDSMKAKYYKYFRVFLLIFLPLVLLGFFFYRSIVMKSGEIGEPYNCQYDYCGLDLIDHQGQIWFDVRPGGECGGVGVLDGEDLTIYSKENSGLVDNCVWDMELDERGRVWFASGKTGISIFDGENWASYTESNSGLSSGFVGDIEFDQKGRAWIGTNYDYVSILYAFDGENWKVYPDLSEGIEGNYISGLTVDRQGNVWVGMSMGGVYVNYMDLWHQYTKDNSILTDNQVRDVQADDEGRVWITTYEGGLFLYDRGDWQNYTDEISKLVPGSVYDIVIDMQSRAWFLSGNVVIYDYVSWSVLDDRYGGEIEMDDQGRIWLIDREDNQFVVINADEEVQLDFSRENHAKSFIESSDYLFLAVVIVGLWITVLLNSWGISLGILMGTSAYGLSRLVFSDQFLDPSFLIMNPGWFGMIGGILGGILGKGMMARINGKAAKLDVKFGIIGTVIGGLLGACSFFLFIVLGISQG